MISFRTVSYTHLDVYKRQAVLQIFAEFLGIFALDIDRQPNSDGGGNAHAQVNGMKAGDKGVKRRVQTGHNVQQLRGSVRKMCIRDRH